MPAPVVREACGHDLVRRAGKCRWLILDTFRDTLPCTTCFLLSTN